MQRLRQRTTRVKTAPCKVYASRDDLASGIVSRIIAPRTRTRTSDGTPRTAHTAPPTGVVKTRLTSADHARINQTVTTNRIDWDTV